MPLQIFDGGMVLCRCSHAPSQCDILKALRRIRQTGHSRRHAARISPLPDWKKVRTSPRQAKPISSAGRFGHRPPFRLSFGTRSRCPPDSPPWKVHPVRKGNCQIEAAVSNFGNAFPPSSGWSRRPAQGKYPLARLFFRLRPALQNRLGTRRQALPW